MRHWDFLFFGVAGFSAVFCVFFACFFDPQKPLLGEKPHNLQKHVFFNFPKTSSLQNPLLTPLRSRGVKLPPCVQRNNSPYATQNCSRKALQSALKSVTNDPKKRYKPPKKPRFLGVKKRPKNGSKTLCFFS